jgi:small subunit ribosomal protein S1
MYMSEEIKAQENETNEVNAAEEAVDMTNVTVIKKGDIVKGKIVKVQDQEALVDIGYKFDGIIPIRELSSVQLENATEAVEVGQEVEVRVVSLDDEKENMILSKRAVDSENAWEELQQKLDSKATIEAKVAEVVKGGLVVDVGIRGFVPASMVERHFVEDFSDYKGRTLRLRVKELDRENNKVILSQKDIMDEEYEAEKQKVLAGLEAGQEIEGTVQRLTPFGVFVDIGGIDGLVHISELSYTHVEHPSEVVKEGDKVKVKILKVEPEKERISLSIKETQPGPWDDLADKFKSGDIVDGEVKRLVTFGAFVEIASGIEGLVHISQIAHRHIATPHEVLKEGQAVKVKILEINPNDKRVSLSIKETEEAPESAKSAKIELAENANVSLDNKGMSLTLGERFGDKLSKFK